MINLHRLLRLPPALLGLILSQTCLSRGKELEWPYNLPPHMKYYPEDEVRVKRSLQAEYRLQQQSPNGMRKMSGDPGEKFLMDYWQFGTEEDVQYCDNASMPIDLIAPLRGHEHASHSRPILPRLSYLFDKRAYECPAGSYACTSIGRSDSCCGIGSTCQLIQDVGLGDVGCCAENQVCAGSVSNCPSGGYTSCPQNPGGGCCLPGYACDSIGCIAISTAVVMVTPTPSTTSASSTVSSQPSVSTDTTTVIVAPSTSSSSSTAPTATAPPSTSTQPTNTLLCSSGFRSCPSSLGGGCCPTDRACGRDVCPEMSSTNSFSAPGRPTSNSATITSTSVPASSTGFTSISGASCPTGFYACSAYYQGGCCRTGRDCDTTSCPVSTSITVVGASSITAVAPTGSGVFSVSTLVTGNCAGGWTTCPADVGGGCCPSGYACGMACTATGTGGMNSTVGRVAPNEAARRRDRLLAVFVGVVGVVGVGAL